MRRNDSLPEINSERGRGLADLHGLDPLDRRVDVEKKQRYAQALKDQIDHNSAASDVGSSDSRRPEKSMTPPRTPSLGRPPLASHNSLSCTFSASAAGDHQPVAPPQWQSPPPVPSYSGGFGDCQTRNWTPDRALGRRDASPMHLDSMSNGVVADKVAQVQELMRQRLQALQENQDRMWQNVQAALQGQANVEQVIEQHVARALEDHSARLQQVVSGQADALQQCQSHFGDLQDEVERHRVQLAQHEEEIRRLWDAHQDCVQSRASTKDELQSLRAELSNMHGLMQELRQDQKESMHDKAAAEHELGILRTQLGEMHGLVQDLQRGHQDCMQSKGATEREIGALRAELGDVARHVAEVPKLMQQVRDLRREASQPKTPPPEVERRERTPPPEVKRSPPVELAVSKAAYAVLRAESEMYELPKLHNTVGRGNDCDVPVSDSQAVSHRHTEITIDASGVASLKDLDSRNGTFVNDHRVPRGPGHVLQSGDSVKLGVDGPTFIFEWGPAYYARWPQNPQLLGGAALLPSGRRQR